MTESTDATSSIDHLTEDDKKNLMSKGLLFEQLLQSEKFQSFFRLNYDLVQTEEEGQMTLYLVEVPDSVTMERARAEMKQAATQAPMIVQATEGDAKRLTKQLGKK